MSYAWGGSQAVASTAAHLAGENHAFISSAKRAANHPLSISNPGSDHNMANTTAYALDFATFNGVPLAYALARHFGISNYRTGNYNSYYVNRGGATYRVQILWAVPGHYNHVHLGVRLVSGNYHPGPEYYVYKPKLPKVLTRKQVELVNKLRYHRYQRSVQARTGKGPKWEKQNNWTKYWYHEIEESIRDMKGSQWHRPAKRAVLRDVLHHKYDYERRKK